MAGYFADQRAWFEADAVDDAMFQLGTRIHHAVKTMERMLEKDNA